MSSQHSTAYGWLMRAAIFVSIALWSRVARRGAKLDSFFRYYSGFETDKLI
jgi:hypothetical protein